MQIARLGDGHAAARPCLSGPLDIVNVIDLVLDGLVMSFHIGTQASIRCLTIGRGLSL
jgi:hypothetical protein